MTAECRPPDGTADGTRRVLTIGRKLPELPARALARECDGCLQVGRLLMPVEYDTMFHRYVTHECLSCRLNFDRHGMADNYTMRIEGRHRLPGAIAAFAAVRSSVVEVE